MSAQILDGKKLAQEIKDKLKAELKGKDSPGLAALLIGNNPASKLYVSMKEKTLEDALRAQNGQTR